MRIVSNTNDLIQKTTIKTTYNLEMKNVAKYFIFPLSIAAKHLNISASYLGKFIKKNGIRKWPYRKLNFISKIIKYQENKNSAIDKFIEMREKIISEPNTKLLDLFSESELKCYSRQIKKKSVLRITRVPFTSSALITYDTPETLAKIIYDIYDQKKQKTILSKYE